MTADFSSKYKIEKIVVQHPQSNNKKIVNVKITNITKYKYLSKTKVKQICSRHTKVKRINP